MYLWCHSRMHVDTFLEHSENYSKDLCDAHDSFVLKQIHKIKGAVASLGAKDIYDYCIEIEQKGACSSYDKEGIVNRIGQLVASMRRWRTTVAIS